MKWLKETITVSKRILCHRLMSWGSIKCEDHHWSVLIISTLLVFLLIGGGITTGILSVIKYIVPTLLDYDKNTEFIRSDNNTANVFAQESQNNRYVEKAESNDTGCNLNNGNWRLWLGDMSRDVRDNQHFFLATDSTQGLFKYDNVYNINWVCDFIFVPRGEKAVNYVISLDGIYQIVIGDNDYWTITMRASDVIDGPLVPIKEEKTQRDRPRLLNLIKPGSIVNVTLKQGFVDDINYKVEIIVDYKHDTLSDIEAEPETFSWLFKPSPDIDIKPIELSIGLIRGRGDNTDVGASFLSPNPDIKKEDFDKSKLGD